MGVFGEVWNNWTGKIETHWRQLISPEDLVLLPGDISWAMSIEGVLPDLEWLENLPGTKIMIRGNHDYWWTSTAKMEKILPSSIHIVQNNAFNFKDVSIAGSRLWETPEYRFDDYIIFRGTWTEKPPYGQRDEKIFLRELSRLELSLQAMDKNADFRIVMTHYPPIGADLQESRASKLLEKYGADICVFGHLHSLKPRALPFGEKKGIRYHLTSCDYIDFKPLKIL